MVDRVLREPWSTCGENYLSIYTAWLNGFFIHFFFSTHWELFLHHRLRHVAGRSMNSMVSSPCLQGTWDLWVELVFETWNLSLFFYYYKKLRTQYKHMKKAPKPDFVCHGKTTRWNPLRNEIKRAKSRAGLRGDECSKYRKQHVKTLSRGSHCLHQ